MGLLLYQTVPRATNPPLPHTHTHTPTVRDGPPCNYFTTGCDGTSVGPSAQASARPTTYLARLPGAAPGRCPRRVFQRFASVSQTFLIVSGAVPSFSIKALNVSSSISVSATDGLNVLFLGKFLTASASYHACGRRWR